MNGPNYARRLDAALWSVAVMVMAYSAGNVHTFARTHGTADPMAWLLAPMVDVALYACLSADAVLSRFGASPGGWAATLRWFCGAGTWTLNAWNAAATGNAGAIVGHSIPPVLLILLAEAAPRYRVRFAGVQDGEPAPAQSHFKQVVDMEPVLPPSENPRTPPDPREQAKVWIAKERTAGRTVTGKMIGDRYGFSARWGQQRIREM